MQFWSKDCVSCLLLVCFLYFGMADAFRIRHQGTRNPRPYVASVSLDSLASYNHEAKGNLRMANTFARKTVHEIRQAVQVAFDAIQQTPFSDLASTLVAEEPGMSREACMCRHRAVRGDQLALDMRAPVQCAIRCGYLATSYRKTLKLQKVSTCSHQLGKSSLIVAASHGEGAKQIKLKLYEENELLWVEAVEGDELFSGGESPQDAVSVGMPALRVTNLKFEQASGSLFKGNEEKVGKEAFARLLEVCDKALEKEVTVRLSWRTRRGVAIRELGRSLERFIAVAQQPKGVDGFAAAFPIAATKLAAARLLSDPALLSDPSNSYEWNGARSKALAAVSQAIATCKAAAEKLHTWGQQTLELGDDVMEKSIEALGKWSEPEHDPRGQPLIDWQPGETHAVFVAVASAVANARYQATAAVLQLDELSTRLRSMWSNEAPNNVNGYDIMQRFVSLSLEGEAVQGKLKDDVRSAGQGLHLQTLQLAIDRSPDSDLASAQRRLREMGAFGFDPLLVVAENATASWNPKALLFGENKEKWARQWSVLRKSMDFTPWPMDPTFERNANTRPQICGAPYFINGEEKRMPKALGGRTIKHTFMVFAGDESGRPDCTDLMQRLAELQTQLTSQDRSENFDRAQALIDYHKVRQDILVNGCRSLEKWADTGIRVKTILRTQIEAMTELTLEIEWSESEKSPGWEKTMVTLPIRGDITAKLFDWVSHAVAKNAARVAADAFWEGEQSVKSSLLKTPPFFSVFELRSQWPLLAPQGITTPFGSNASAIEEMLKLDEGIASVAEALESWSIKKGGFWHGGIVRGDSLDALLAAVDAASAGSKSGDWAVLAQTPALKGALGFDGKGVSDDSDWGCTETLAACPVHPQCGRIAAQMLTYPFSAAKDYAGAPPAKVWTFLSSGLGSFDSDGFHSYCHQPGSAYCWSYTGCLVEMMKWLCSQDETAKHCCPNEAVAAECAKNVNGKGCQVCMEPGKVPQARNASDAEAYNAEMELLNS